MPPYPPAVCRETSDGGLGEGFLVETNRRNRGWVSRMVQMPGATPLSCKKRELLLYLGKIHVAGSRYQHR